VNFGNAQNSTDLKKSGARSRDALSNGQFTLQFLNGRTAWKENSRQSKKG